jgi:hypothetical protein
MTSTKVLVSAFFGSGEAARIGPLSSFCHHLPCPSNYTGVVCHTPSVRWAFDLAARAPTAWKVRGT